MHVWLYTCVHVHTCVSLCLCVGVGGVERREGEVDFVCSTVTLYCAVDSCPNHSDRYVCGLCLCVCVGGGGEGKGGEGDLVCSTVTLYCAVDSCPSPTDRNAGTVTTPKKPTAP